MAINTEAAPPTADVLRKSYGVIAPVATDLATAISLVNELRQIALNSGQATAT